MDSPHLRNQQHGFTTLMGSKRSIGCLAMAVVLAGFAASTAHAGRRTITLTRCGYLHQILPGGPLGTRGTYAFYAGRVSCALARNLLTSRGSRLPHVADPSLLTEPTAVAKVGGTTFVCTSGDAGGGLCLSPLRVTQKVPGGPYVTSGHPTIAVTYANCSFAGNCTKSTDKLAF
jgi:hypothetical protein